MLEQQLQLLASTVLIDIFKYSDQTMTPISVRDDSYPLALMIKALKDASDSQYSLYRHTMGYILIVPVSTGEKLLLVPRSKNFTFDKEFSNLEFLNRADALSKLVYFLYCGQIAPKRHMEIKDLADEEQGSLRKQAIGALEDFHRLTVQMLPSLDKLDEAAFQHSLTLLKQCYVLSQLLSSPSVIRGKQNILIGFTAILGAQLTKSGFPARQTISLESVAMEKIELNGGDLDFDFWLTELANGFFQSLKEYRSHLFVDKAEQIETYLRANVRKNIPLKSIADALHISQQSLNTIFKRKYHMTIHQYAIQLKMQASQKMLTETQLKIKEIAKYLSFVDESYFVLTFNKSFGITPARYRKKSTQHMSTGNNREQVS